MFLIPTKFNHYKILLPTLFSIITTTLCPMDKSDGIKLPQRPPAFVFGIIWPILYLLIGYCWSLSTSNIEECLFWILNVLLCLWIVYWSCRNDKKKSLYIIACCITTTLMLIKISKNGIYLCPLFGWLIYAMMLNYHSIV